LLERGLRTPGLDVLLRFADALRMDAATLVKMTQRRLENSSAHVVGDL